MTDRFPFRTNDYYLSLIDWNDPEDPIRRVIIPDMQELDDWGQLDPSDEKSYTVMPGLEHKYPSTVLLIVSNVCDAICRYCFRKRVFTESCKEHKLDLDKAIEYIKKHREITNILLTGGDPLTLKTSKLEEIIQKIGAIDHVQIIRIGTKIPVYNPYRISEDVKLRQVIKKYSRQNKKIYIMTHFIHPRELTDTAIKAVNLLQKADAIVINQAPLMKGINDNPKTLAKLLRSLSFIGIIPYYIFQCRPALGNSAYAVPIETGYDIIEQAKSQLSGLAKQIRFVMSHSTGKIEILGKSNGFTYFKYHRAARDERNSYFMALKNNPQARWLDDYDDYS